MKYEYEVSEFKKAYRRYLELKHPELSHINITTKVGDAFFLFGQTRESEAWAILRKSEPQIRNLLLDEFLTERKRPVKDASGYLRAFRELKEFIALVEMIEQARTLQPRLIQLPLDGIDIF